METSVGRKLQLDLVDTEGAAVPLGGDSATFVYFMRAPSCAQCNSAVRKLAAQQEALKRNGVEVVIALPTDSSGARAWKESKSVALTVATGRVGSAHEEAGLLRRVFGLVQQSGGILVDREGTVRYSHIATNPGDSLRPQELDHAVDLLSAA